MTSKSDKISPAQARMDYGFARARDLAFDAVQELWRKRQSTGLTQIDLAKKLGKDAGWLSKKLKGPGNWTLRTLGEMVEALDGELEIRVFPLEEPLHPARNFDAYAMKTASGDEFIKPNPPVQTGSKLNRQFSIESV